MNRGAVFITAIAEAMAINIDDAKDLFHKFLRATKQYAADYQDCLSAEEVQELVSALRQEHLKIRQWFMPGGIAGDNGEASSFP